MVAIAAITLLAICHYTKFLLFHKAGHNLSMPPGPTAWPIIGHLHLLDAKRPLHQTLYHLAQTYGSIMLLKFGSRNVLVVTSWELAKECLTTHDMNFACRPRSAGAEHLGYDCKLLGLDPYDRRCQKLRRICTLHLLSPSRVEASINIRTEEMSKFVRGLFERCTQMGIRDREASAVVNVREIVVGLIFDIMVRLILTRKSYLGSEEEVKEFIKITTVSTSELLGAFNLGDCIPSLRWLDLQGCERAMKKLHRRRDEFLQRVIENSRLCMKKENDESMIDVLLHLVDKAKDFCSEDAIVKATAISLMIGATDTYANTTEWAMATLLQRPDVLKRAREELDVIVGRERVLEESDLPKLKYLEAIVKETLRLYPVVPLLLPHVAAAPCTVGGYYIPEGTELLLNAWGIHKDPAVWERPLQFEPERFINSSVDVNGHDFKYIPFGYGRRACPGMWVAMRMLLLTVGRLLQSFDWSIPEEIEGVDMNEGRALSLHRAVPLEAAIRPRLPHHLY